MNATELGNRPASEMTYRQKIVLALLPDMARACHSPRDYAHAWLNASAAADAILASEAQEANHD